jgi:hypothetical protein
MFTKDSKLETRSIERLTPPAGHTQLPYEAQGAGLAAEGHGPAMDLWKSFQNRFNALKEEEDRNVQQGVSRDCCSAYVTHQKSGEFGGWVVGSTSESLLAQLELVATEAGIALGSPAGILPLTYLGSSPKSVIAVESLCML